MGLIPAHAGSGQRADKSPGDSTDTYPSQGRNKPAGGYDWADAGNCQRTEPSQQPGSPAKHATKYGATLATGAGIRVVAVRRVERVVAARPAEILDVPDERPCASALATRLISL